MALKLRRWQKQGHDRLYITTASGSELGWVDLRTNRDGIRVPGMWPEIQAAVNRWKSENPGWSQSRPARPAGISQSRQPLRRGDLGVDVDGDGDLAAVRAGAGVQQRADQLRPGWGIRLLSGVFGHRTADRSWAVGAAGERAVGKKLDKLARKGKWRVLHSVQLGGGGDLDHLLIGPLGVFCINSKHHPGGKVRVTRKGIRVGKRETSYADKAGREARRVQLALRSAGLSWIAVQPVIVVHGHASLSGRRNSAGVSVLASSSVWWWFRVGRARLSTATVEQVYAIARQSSTWAGA
ncbi:nuclease-related domain-containing protein [Longispora sp. NPDC051575]|uniref:nuclease-related domain-containing protein n=1 Tax=Longispora sp. NPDC051575 TaxID=3154943 RepID=UPI0034413336